MPEINGSNPSPSGSAPRQVAIVGLNQETARLLPSLMDADGIQVIKILNPELEDLSRLTQYPNLAVIIDTTQSAVTAARLRKLPLKRVDVISGLGARILFCSIPKDAGPAEGGKDKVFRSLEEIREAMSVSGNKDEILKVILNTAVKTLGADCGSLMVLDPTGKQLSIQAAVGLDEKVVVSSIQRAGQGVSGSAIRRREPILIQGAVDAEAHSAEYTKPELVSSICCPMIHEGEALGVLNISSKSSRRTFDERDAELLVQFAGLGAELVKSSRDYDSPHPAVGSVGVLNNVREILSMKYRFEERLNLLLMKMSNAMNAKVCTYYSFNPQEKTFHAAASSSVSVGVLRDNPMVLEEFFAQRVLKTSGTFCVNGTSKQPRVKNWYLLQPIRSGQELMGTLFVNLYSEKNLLKEETLLLRKIGELLQREVARAREMETYKAHSLKYSAIAQYSADAGRTQSLAELAEMTVQNMGAILEAQTCVLRLRNAAGDGLAVHATHSRKDPALVKDILALDELVMSEMAPGREILLIEDLRESALGMDNLGSESALAAALIVDGQILGTLSMYDKETPDASGSRSFTTQDREILQNFCAEARKGLQRFHPFPSPIASESALVA